MFQNLKKYKGLATILLSLATSGCHYYSYTLNDSDFTLTPYEISRLKVMEVKNEGVIITPEGQFFVDENGKRHFMHPRETKYQILERIDESKKTSASLAEVQRPINSRN